MLLDDCISLFLDEKKLYCAAATVEYYSNMLHRFKLFADSVHLDDIQDLNVDVLRSYLAFLRSIQIKNTSIQTYFRGIKNFLSWAILEGFCKPFNYKIKLPRPDPDLDLPLSEIEVSNILKYIESSCGPEKLLLFRLMLDCGLRSSEALNLRGSDINFGSDIIQINQSKYEKSRLIPLPEQVKDLLDPDRSGPLFNLSSSGKNSFFVRLQKNCNIPRLHAHLLRHTFATSYMMQRGNLEFLRMYLGHSSYDVTKTYIQSAFQCQITHYKIYKISDIFS